MKIKNVLLIVMLLGLCGCTSKLNCNLDVTEYKSDAEITIQGNDVKGIVVTNTYKSNEQAKNACEILSQTTDKIECNNNSVVIKEYQVFLKLPSLTKESVTEYFVTHNYTCK